MSWKEWLEGELPNYLDERGELKPPWVRFPHYERGTIGWRMGDGETWMGLWYHFCEKLDKQGRIDHLRRHPRAPENWADIIFRVLNPDWDSEVDSNQYQALRKDGFVGTDAAFHNWLLAGSERVLPFWDGRPPSHAAQYLTRTFSFWSRAYHDPGLRTQYQIPPTPTPWTEVEQPLDNGWQILAGILLRGFVLTPWAAGLEPMEPDYSAGDGADFIDAYARWLCATFDDEPHLSKYLIANEAPEEWRTWAQEVALPLF